MPCRLGQAWWRALTLDTDFYTKTTRARRTLRSAQIVVGVAALSHTVGSSMILLTYNTSLGLQLLAFLINAASIVAGYYIWTFTIWQFGVWLQASIPRYKRLLNPIGFTYAPQVFNIFTVVPLLGRPIELGLAVWSLIAAIVALQSGCSLKRGKAISICTLGWVVVQVAIGVVQIGVQGFL
ncbi:hypothetical protein [Thermocoleostomius sinensis]|uniref:Yip1 domain-containing protein n=1 Tax=Thermocoleostomius sinensis A174 TaxID=2016057 RepID=A0A9E8ZB75_9CYAN|nr:hypothetical protein [Thermocoleostomius sinensis]WAL59602.1 hypothetical protein OXH18_20895 [Thermocoleostomius sinensis A174]